MATMPFWQVEGLILYGLLCGYTYSASLVPAVQAAPPVARQRMTASSRRRLVAQRSRVRMRANAVPAEPPS